MVVHTRSTCKREVPSIIYSHHRGRRASGGLEPQDDRPAEAQTREASFHEVEGLVVAGGGRRVEIVGGVGLVFFEVSLFASWVGCVPDRADVSCGLMPRGAVHAIQ
jgi:hypothetical protein